MWRKDNMKIFITCPSFAIHGGIRVILEWANRLAKQHVVYLRVLKSGSCTWFAISSEVKIVKDDKMLRVCDCLIITSPHSIHYQDYLHRPKKIFLFLQALEHLFNPDPVWQLKCKNMYHSIHPLFYISGWGGNFLRKLGRKGRMIHIGNGINFNDFPLYKGNPNAKTILVEGWSNHSVKDPDRVVPAVTKQLMKEGYRVLLFSAVPVTTCTDSYNTIFVRPQLSVINQLYDQSYILLKASKYDARPYAPLEAMTKGVPSVVGKIEGYDDLIHEQNAILTGYNADELYSGAIRLLTDQDLRNKLSDACFQYVQTQTWEYWMKKINEVICG